MEAEGELLEGGGMSDQQKTLVILVPFVIVTIIIAVLVQWLVG